MKAMGLEPDPSDAKLGATQIVSGQNHANIAPMVPGPDAQWLRTRPEVQQGSKKCE